mmetsp:Transcript_18619/g.40059  ORF Transcript_18619/g.40059 Transcript_18619/m.40059 type:complete len:104 (-) Transcript_18619:215-526(-)
MAPARKRVCKRPAGDASSVAIHVDSADVSAATPVATPDTSTLDTESSDRSKPSLAARSGTPLPPISALTEPATTPILSGLSPDDPLYDDKYPIAPPMSSPTTM